MAGQHYRHDQFQLSGGWDLRHPRPWDKMTAVTTTRNLTWPGAAASPAAGGELAVATETPCWPDSLTYLATLL
ncbi:MAG: hypothetical protein ACLQB1_25055 [Streptosporangiaceae bacterium]